MFLEPCLGNCSWTRCLTLVYRNLAWEPVLGSLAWEPVLGCLFLGTGSSEHCLITCSWELSLGNLFLETLPASFKPVHWYLAWEPVFRNFGSGTLFRNLSFGTLLGILFLLPTLLAAVFRNFALQVVLGKLFLGT